MSTALNSRRRGHTEPPPVAPTSCRQKAWDSPRARTAAVALLEAAPDETTRACLLATRRRESGAWLQVPPPLHVSTQPPHEWQRGEGGSGPLSGSQPLSTPPLSPVWDGGRTPWATWSQLQDEPGSRLAACSDQRTDQEDTGISQSTFTPGAIGHLVCGWEKARWGNDDALEVWSGPDLGCNMPPPNTYAPSHLASAAREAGAVANQAEQRKTEKYAHLELATTLCPSLLRPGGCLDLKHCPCWKTLADKSE